MKLFFIETEIRYNSKHSVITHTKIIMSAIGLDILKIGGAKWNQQFSEFESASAEYAPSHFMLPSVENVSMLTSTFNSENNTVCTLLAC